MDRVCPCAIERLYRIWPAGEHGVERQWRRHKREWRIRPRNERKLVAPIRFSSTSRAGSEPWSGPGESDTGDVTVDMLGDKVPTLDINVAGESNEDAEGSICLGGVDVVFDRHAMMEYGWCR